MNSPMLDAFLKQQKYTDQQARNIEIEIQKIKDKNLSKATTQMNRPQEIKLYTNVPTKLKEGELNHKTISHPQLKNYNHSLEMKRDIGLKSGKPNINSDGEIEYDDGITMGNLTSKDLLE